MRGHYALTKPCSSCPFRNDIRPFLRKDRVRQIEQSLVQSEFHCHLTAEHDDEGEQMHTGNEVHCAGALILMEKMGRPSQMMRISERLGMYDRTKLDMNAPVFNSFREMIKAQSSR